MATVIEEPRRKEQAAVAVVSCGRSVTVADETRQVSVPSWVVDLDSFCQWVETDVVPEKLRVWYLKGEVWIDMSKEQVITHVLLKTRFFIVLGALVDAGRLGRFYADGLFLRNKAADVAGNPDAVFASTATLLAKRLRPVPGKKGGIVALEGSPDMVLEIVSTSSVRKDNVVMKQAYWEAGAREYWLVDARKEPLTFDIFRHTAKGYTATRKQDGWLKSAVFGKSFRLTRQVDPALGDVVFNLELR
jgi:Uma2 family endonuclease